MAAHRYWRLSGFSVGINGPLELSEAQLYAAGARADAGATITCSFAPAAGLLAYLGDGDASSVVSWEFPVHTFSGFSLVWHLIDEADVSAVRLGSGGSPGSFPVDFFLQWSDDSESWTTTGLVSGVTYPGAYSLTAEPATLNVDPSFHNVVLLVHADGTNGSTNVIDSGPSRRSVTCFGGAAISTAKSRFGGSSLYFDGANTTMARCPTNDLEFRQNWSVAAWVYRLSATQGTVLHIRGTQPVGVAQEGQNGIHIHISANGALNVDNGAVGTIGSAAGAIPVGAWRFIEVVRNANVTTGYVSIASVLSHASQDTLSVLREIVIGRFTQNNVGLQALPTFHGFIDELRIKVGEAVRATEVPTMPFSGLEIIPITTSAGVFKTLSPGSDQYVGPLMPDSSAHGHLREFPFFDVFNGGIGLITGTVKEKSLPSNVPLARKVWLMDEASGMVVREIWSDATTGNYEFRGIKQGVKYTVLAYDYTGLYRAVIADAQVPEAMP